MSEFTSTERQLIRQLVSHYELNSEVLSTFLSSLRGQIQGSKALRGCIHSLSWRMKEPDHLEDKLKRNLRKCKERGKQFRINTSNLFVKINDLAGLRILHLYTQQVDGIKNGLKELFSEESYKVLEGPTARTWDDESRTFFKSIGIKTKSSPSLYTSVHYVITPNKKTKYTCEIQVRTLMEEVWGQVDHTLNYPYRTKHLACREQLAALARATSSCTRLVDSIFRSYTDAESIRQKLLRSRRLLRGQ
jgi:putative GTP pyrophosphokinase